MRKINDIPAVPVFSDTIVYIGQDINQTLVHQLQEEGYQCLLYTDAFKAYVYLLAEVYANAPLPYAILCQEDLKARRLIHLCQTWRAASGYAQCPAFCYWAKTSK